MTPKEKAEKLIRKYWNSMFNLPIDIAKECALIAVDEIIKFGNSQGFREPMMYWYKVKEELEKL
jgi:hypothetical protein